VWNDPAVFQTLDKCDAPANTKSTWVVNDTLPERNGRLCKRPTIPTFLDANKIERTAFADTYYSTASLQSSVPLSSHSFETQQLRDRPALDWETALESASYTLDKVYTKGWHEKAKWLAAV
jgi:hypothetical protein